MCFFWCFLGRFFKICLVTLCRTQFGNWEIKTVLSVQSELTFGWNCKDLETLGNLWLVTLYDLFKRFGQKSTLVTLICVTICYVLVYKGCVTSTNLTFPYNTHPHKFNVTRMNIFKLNADQFCLHPIQHFKVANESFHCPQKKSASYFWSIK